MIADVRGSHPLKSAENPSVRAIPSSRGGKDSMDGDGTRDFDPGGSEAAAPGCPPFSSNMTRVLTTSSGVVTIAATAPAMLPQAAASPGEGLRPERNRFES